MTDKQERLLNYARCVADVAAEGCHHISPDTPIMVTITFHDRGTSQASAEAVAFSDDYQPIASRRAELDEARADMSRLESLYGQYTSAASGHNLRLVDEYADANVDDAA